MKIKKITQQAVRMGAPGLRKVSADFLTEQINRTLSARRGTHEWYLCELASRELQRRGRIAERKQWHSLIEARRDARLRAEAEAHRPVETLSEYVMDEKTWIVSCGSTTVSFFGSHEAADALGRKLRGLDDSPAVVKLVV